MKKYYITVGFMGSGSSAMTELLSEFRGITSANGDFEYVFLYTPNGVFDLEDKLLRANNALRSDEAIHSFLDCMNDLYRKKNYWVANYKERVSNRFLDYVHTFVNDLTTTKLETSSAYWYYMQNPTRIMTAQRLVRKAVYVCSLKKLLLPPPLRYHGMILSFPKSDEYYEAAKRFIYAVMDAVKGSSDAVILDQFLLPHNLSRIDLYFNDDVKAVLIDRDPRDVFLSNKYYWIPKHTGVPFATDAKMFCIQYKRMRECMQEIKSEKVIHYQFEDLVYNYDSTIKDLYDKLELSEQLHVDKKKNFNPEISIVNTNIKRKNPMFIQEAEIIEHELPQYLYQFPIDYHYSDKNQTVF